jgi:hypothetical protein
VDAATVWGLVYTFSGSRISDCYWGARVGCELKAIRQSSGCNEQNQGNHKMLRHLRNPLDVKWQSKYKVHETGHRFLVGT